MTKHYLSMQKKRKIEVIYSDKKGRIPREVKQSNNPKLKDTK